jgi:hypothetical protein
MSFQLNSWTCENALTKKRGAICAFGTKFGYKFTQNHMAQTWEELPLPLLQYTL